MFSTSQLDMSQSLIATYFLDGYDNYICHTNTNLDDSYFANNYNFYDLTFYFSKSPITVVDNTFTFSGDVIKVDVITRNVSNNENDNKLDRIKSNNFTSNSVSIPLYEHIMSNADGEIFMNTLSQQEYNLMNDISYNIDFNDFIVIPVILCILVISTWLRSWFGKNYKR